MPNQHHLQALLAAAMCPLSTILEGNVAPPQRRQKDEREDHAQHTHGGRMREGYVVKREPI